MASVNPTKFNKLLIGARNVVQHRSLVNFDFVDAESDRNYKIAEERFLTFRTQLQDVSNLREETRRKFSSTAQSSSASANECTVRTAVINTTELFRTRLAESAEASSQLANNFMRISLQPDEVNEPWTALAKKQSELLRTMAGTAVDAAAPCCDCVAQ
eukprot:15550-Heterococcus_DN1.PRE.6